MKYIIENNSDLPDGAAFILIQKVIDAGKISNDGKQHSFITTMFYYGKDYMVYSILNKSSERLVVVNDTPSLAQKTFALTNQELEIK